MYNNIHFVISRTPLNVPQTGHIHMVLLPTRALPWGLYELFRARGNGANIEFIGADLRDRSGWSGRITVNAIFYHSIALVI